MNAGTERKRRLRMNQTLQKMGLVVCFLFFLMSGGRIGAQAPEHFYNPSEKINPDPNYTPGDFPLGDTNNARTLYQIKKMELTSGLLQGEPGLLTTLGAGEISFTSIKNETATVLGYFRNYFGLGKIDRHGSLKRLDLIIDMNSLDTAVPGRTNRILDLFFQSTKPEFGTTVLRFEQFESGFKSLRELKEGKEYLLKAKGHLTLNGVTQEISADLSIERQNQMWVAESREPVTLLISDFAFGEQVYELMKSCNHQSLGNRVDIRAKLYFK